MEDHPSTGWFFLLKNYANQPLPYQRKMPFYFPAGSKSNSKPVVVSGYGRAVVSAIPTHLPAKEPIDKVTITVENCDIGIRVVAYEVDTPDFIVTIAVGCKKAWVTKYGYININCVTKVLIPNVEGMHARRQLVKRSDINKGDTIGRKLKGIIPAIHIDGYGIVVGACQICYIERVAKIGNGRHCKRKRQYAVSKTPGKIF